MGFFGGALKSLTGGSDSKSSSASGYGALPKFAQGQYRNYTGQVGNLFDNGDSGAYTPIPQTAQETQAFGLSQLPTTQQGVSQLTNNFLNPLEGYVANGINQSYNQQNSSYLSSLANDGQVGTNREFLNTAYNDQLRDQALGSTYAGAYQGAQNTALSQNQQNISNLTDQGSFQRNLALQTAQAPQTALQAFGALLGLFPNSSTSTSSGSTVGGLDKLLPTGSPTGAAK